jgi:hypothetical protein
MVNSFGFRKIKLFMTTLKNKFYFFTSDSNTDDRPLQVYTGLDPALRSTVEYIASDKK